MAAPVFEMPLFLLLSEDEYETKFGDGYYAYFAGAFRDQWAAEGHAEVQCGKGLAYHVKPAVLRVEGNSITVTGTFHEHDQFTPAEVLGYLLKHG